MSKTKAGTLGLLAFIAMIIYAVCYGVSLIGGNLGIVEVIGQLLVLFIVFVVAFKFAKTCSTPWQVTYWVIVVLAIALPLIDNFK